jgi:hypothetical protein
MTDGSNLGPWVRALFGYASIIWCSVFCRFGFRCLRSLCLRYVFAPPCSVPAFGPTSLPLPWAPSSFLLEWTLRSHFGSTLWHCACAAPLGTSTLHLFFWQCSTMARTRLSEAWLQILWSEPAAWRRLGRDTQRRREFVLTAVKQSPKNCEFAGALKADREFVLDTAKRDGFCLEFSAAALRVSANVHSEAESDDLLSAKPTATFVLHQKVTDNLSNTEASSINDYVFKTEVDNSLNAKSTAPAVYAKTAEKWGTLKQAQLILIHI